MKPFFKESDATYMGVGSLNIDKARVVPDAGDRNLISITDANRLLHKRAIQIWGCQNQSLDQNFQGNWFRSAFERATHTALLINIESIEKDSAEKIVEDFLKLGTFGEGDPIKPLLDRAKKLREAK